jgi:hypothetical protein
MIPYFPAQILKVNEKSGDWNAAKIFIPDPNGSPRLHRRTSGLR